MYGTDISLEGYLMGEAADVDYVVLRIPLDEKDAAIWDRVSDPFTLEEQNTYWALYRRAVGG